MTEEWRKVPGHENYSVSNYGNVFNDVHNRPLKPVLRSDGYLKVSLTKSTQMKVHRIVMLSFEGPSEMQVDHIDEDKSNNRLDNLRYLTARLNTRRSVSSKSGHHNIRFKDNRYQVVICIQGKQKYIGCFKTLEEAIERRDNVLDKCASTDK